MAKAQILLEAEPLRLLEVPQLVQAMGNIAAKSNYIELLKWNFLYIFQSQAQNTM